MGTKLPSEAEYLARERAIFRHDMAQAERGSRTEKVQAQAEWVKAMATEPGLVAERIEWLLAGHYGKGANDTAWEAVDHTAVDPTMPLLNVIAALEWAVPRAYVQAAYHEIEGGEYEALRATIAESVKRAKANRP